MGHFYAQESDKIMELIQEEGEWHKFKDTYNVGIIFPMSVLRFLPGIILNVNWLKVDERVFGC